MIKKRVIIRFFLELYYTAKPMNSNTGCKGTPSTVTAKRLTFAKKKNLIVFRGP